MKKLLLCIFLLISVSCLAQEKIFFSTFKNVIGKWEKYDKKWTYGKFSYVDITFVYSQGYLTCNDEAKSYYKLKGSSTIEKMQGIDVVSFSDVADERGRNCIVSFLTYEDGSKVITIMYSDTIFRYYVQPELSQF